jgi:shikimate dehydrogenase
MFTLESPEIKYAVIGDPINHSVSPAMQNAGFMAAGLSERYGKYHVKPEDLAEFVEFARKNLYGFNATVPHKSALIPLLDEIAPAALAAHSVNTVIVRDGKLYGDSTDGYGLESALKEAFDLDIANSNIVMLGAGGAAQATAFEFVQRKAKSLTIINRTRSKAEDLAVQLSGKDTLLTALGNNETAAIAAAVISESSTASAPHLVRGYGSAAAPFRISITRDAVHTSRIASTSSEALSVGS